MTTIELAWKKEQKILDKEIKALGIERAMLLWIRGGEVALAVQAAAAAQIRAEYVAFQRKSAARLMAKKPK